MKVVFFGTPQIAANILKSLLENGVQVVAVVTKPDKKQGRDQKLQPSAVKAFLQNNHPHIPILQPTKVSTPEYEEMLKTFQSDLFVVVAYGEILRQNILDIPKIDCINIHASLLPKYRGAAPMHRAIINGETETGVCIMQMVLALDAGDILEVLKTPIPIDMNVGDLEKKIEQLGVKGALDTINKFISGKITRTPQDEKLATYASKISVEECEIHWDLPALQIHNLIRGTSPYPGAWCHFLLNDQKKRLKVLKAKLAADSSNKAPGTILHYDQSGFVIKTRDAAIQLLQVQMEGKKACSAEEFVRGYTAPNFLFV